MINMVVKTPKSLLGTISTKMNLSPTCEPVTEPGSLQVAGKKDGSAAEGAVKASVFD